MERFRKDVKDNAKDAYDYFKRMARHYDNKNKIFDEIAAYDEGCVYGKTQPDWDAIDDFIEGNITGYKPTIEDCFFYGVFGESWEDAKIAGHGGDESMREGDTGGVTSGSFGGTTGAVTSHGFQSFAPERVIRRYSSGGNKGNSRKTGGTIQYARRQRKSYLDNFFD